MSDFINPIKQSLFDFLSELKSNNNREWFADNKHRYISDVRDPLLEFIYHFGEPLGQISPHFIADSRPNGGSCSEFTVMYGFQRTRNLTKPMPEFISGILMARMCMLPAFIFTLSMATVLPVVEYGDRMVRYSSK